MRLEGSLIAILDREGSSVKALIEASLKGQVKVYQDFSKLLDNQNIENLAFAFVDTEFVSEEQISSRLSQFRDRFPLTPLIALTGNKDAGFIVQLYSWGFDEFLLKPINKDDLFLRCSVKKEQMSKVKEKPISMGEISVDPSSRSLKNLANGKSKFLSPIEVSLLCILLSAANHGISREEVKMKCWGNANVSDNALNRKLFEVRKALSEIESDYTIKTLYGSGYALQKKKKTVEQKHF